MMKFGVWIITLSAVALTGGCVKPSECSWSEFIHPTAVDVDVISESLTNQLLGHNESREENCR